MEKKKFPRVPVESVLAISATVSSNFRRRPLLVIFVCLFVNNIQTISLLSKRSTISDCDVQAKLARLVIPVRCVVTFFHLSHIGNFVPSCHSFPLFSIFES